MASLDPFSGQEVYNDANSLSASMAIEGMQGAGVDAPLAFRMLENMPGIATSIGFSTSRGAGTVLRGGFMDGPSRFSRSRRSKYRIMQDGMLTDKNKGQFFMGRSGGVFGRRAEKMAAGTKHVGFAKSARVNNMTARPRALGRFHSVSVFGKNSYTPFGASTMISGNNTARSFFQKRGVDVAAGEHALGPGLFSFVSAGRSADLLERKALKGSARAAAKLAKTDISVGNIIRMNNADLFKFGQIGDSFVGTTSGAVPHSARPAHARKAKNRKLKGNQKAKLGFQKPVGVSGERSAIGSVYTRAMESSVGGSARFAGPDDIAKGIFRQAPPGYAAPASNVVGVRGNLMASSLSAPGSRYMAGYFRGALGHAGKEGLAGEATKGALRAVSHFETALGKVGIEGTGAMLEGSVVKNLGLKGFGKTFATHEGAKVLGARAAAMAIPGLNVLATASLVYDLGKMGGEVIKSGINLARDASKSMKGSIYKPVFGMGYQDTEAAATSRSRGVMAIQNSQLNARSALGNEAAMMAAHFG